MIRPPDILVMGVSGCGKTTVGNALAAEIGSVFLDADDFHPPENVTKMSAGIALTDEDREPWLALIAAELSRLVMQGETFVLACSALKERYRQVIAHAAPGLVVVLLEGTPDQLRERLSARKDHFMPPALLDSQFAALESPPAAIRLDIAAPVVTIISHILTTLKLHV